MAQMTLLNEFISDIECLNEDDENGVKNLFQNTGSVLKSDTDQQLLIKISFRQPLKVSGIRFHGVSEGTAPSEVKVFSNNMNLDFGSAEDTPATQDILLGPKECNVAGTKDHIYELKFVKFQTVNSLQLFVAENYGQEDISELRFLEIFGDTGEKSNISDWKPVKC